MVPVEALKLALSKEMEAIQLYQRLLVEAPVAKDTFLFLIDEEQKHKHLIEQKIVEASR